MGTGWVDSILTGVFVMIGIIMTFFILLQEGKGGGLAALGGTKAAGVEGVTNPIRRATGYLAGLFFILAIILGILHKPKESLGLGVEAPPAEIVPAAGTGNGAALKPADAPKPAEAPKTDAKPADAAKTDAKPTDAAKPADAPKTDAPKTEETKPADAPKTDAKPAETPKTDAPKPAEEPKKADEKK